MLVGYALVSTDEQNLNLQRDVLQAAGCEKIFEDQISGAKAKRPGKRPGLQAVLQFAGLGDTLMIWRLDRLNRSLKDLIDMVKLLELNSIGLKSLKRSVDTFPVPGC